ncbi:MAG: zf-HC2 domain-containing protein [Thermoanaerobaculales bacterium]|jgi:hypothetical protein|nr:zf-HC2 domain-containing protein [Thermoanaerobaculales bacterium]
MTRFDCEQLLSKLDELVDGTLDEANAAAARDHLETCTTCRAEVDLGIELREAARALPRSIQPERDLWPGIAAEIDDRRVVKGSFRPPTPARTWLKFAAAAAVLVASVTIAYLVGLEQARPMVVESVTAENDYTMAAYGDVSSDLESASKLLRAGLEQRRDELSPETWSVVMENLSVIDGAIDRIESAMAKNPGDVRLNRQLATAYRRQIDLLQRATKLPAEA